MFFTSMSLKTKVLFSVGLLFLAVGGLFYSVHRISNIGASNTRQLSEAIDDIVGHKAELRREMASIKLHVVQVQQFLTDLSATRGQDGLNDGADIAKEHAAEFYSEIDKAIGLAKESGLPEIAENLEASKKDFAVYYDLGQKMANAYVTEGPAGGNKMMEAFDTAANKINERIDASFAKAGELVKEASIKAAETKDNANKSLEHEVFLADIAIGVAAVIITYLSWFMINLVWSLISAAKCLDAAAKGDINRRMLHIRGTNELDLLKRNINRLLDITEAFLKEADASMAAAARKAYYRQIISTGMPGLFGSVSNRVGNTMNVMRERDEAFDKRLKAMTDKFDSNITSFIGELSQSSSVLKGIANDLGTLSQTSLQQSSNLLNASQVSTSSVNIVVSTTEELSSSIQEINFQINKASGISRDAVLKSQDANTTITAFQEGAKKIGDIVGFIGDIANQTNLLALNATIEAARAGDAGKGFAVVASEVKELANKTSEATTEISGQVSELLRSIDTTVRVIEDIGSIIAKIDESSSSISSAMEEQGAAVAEILRNMQNASESAQQTSSATDAVAETARSTDKMSHTLNDASTNLSKKSVVIAGELEVFLSNLKSH